MGIGGGPPVGFFPERLLGEKENEMSHRDSEREKLVEEIASIITSNTGLEPGSALLMARFFITRISQAIADGELPLLGEVVFAHTPDKVVEYEIAVFWDDLWRRMKAEGWLNSGLTTLIALRKEEEG